MTNKLLYTIIGFLIVNFSFAQQDYEALNKKFDDFAKIKKGLNDIVKTDVSGLSLNDFINSIAQDHQLNVSVDTDLNQPVTNNFFDVTVKDVFVFVVQKYDLDVDFINNIIIFKKRKEVKIIVKKTPKVIDVSYNSLNDFLSVKLESDSLPNVVQAIIDKSGKNVIMSSEIKSQKISSYILNRPFDQVLEMMAKSNNLTATKEAYA